MLATPPSHSTSWNSSFGVSKALNIPGRSRGPGPCSWARGSSRARRSPRRTRTGTRPGRPRSSSRTRRPGLPAVWPFPLLVLARRDVSRRGPGDALHPGTTPVPGPDHPPTSRAAARNPPVVPRDLVPGLLRRERFGELVGAVLHRRVKRMVEPHAEEPALGGCDRAGVRRGAFEQALGGFGEEAGLADDVGDAVRRQLVEPVSITGQDHLACLAEADEAGQQGR